MDRLKLDDLAPSMRLDDSLHLTSGELVLYRRQAVDELLLDALAAGGVTELALVSSPAEVEALALDADRQAVPLDGIRERTVFTWGLYEVTGRKALSACRRLTVGRSSALRSAGVDVLLEPADDLAARAARRRRLLSRRRAPRRGRGPVSMAPDTVLRRAAVRGPSRAVSKPEAAHDALLSPSGDVARTALALAVLASEIEVLVRELALGLSLDVPRTLEAARSVVSDTFAGPFIASGAALEMLEPGKHRERVAASGVIAVAMARAAGWQEDECLELAACALLHDAPYPWLAGSPEEEEAEGDVEGMGRAVSRRPLRAHMLLADADGLAPAVALAALQAEERMDGSGRPFGLTADEILPGARMLAVADEFCRAVSRRRARGRLSGHEAVKRCIELAGAGLLDGDAVRALLNAVGLYPLGSLVRLSTGEIARVVATSEAYERPIVKVTLTPSGLPPAQDRVMDLSRLAGIRVERAVPGESGPPGGKGPPGLAED